MRRVRGVVAGLSVVVGLVAAPAAHAQGLSESFSLAALDVPAPWQTFNKTSQPATFDQPAAGAFTVTAAGADLWQASDEYGVVYQKDATPANFEAVVKVPSFTGTHNASKAGIMIRNDVTVAKSTGYMVLSRKGDGEAEFLHDAGGNGQVNDGDEPVANGCAKVKTTALWLKVRKIGTSFQTYCSRDGVGWTPLGGPITVATAEAAQDIGLFVTSHESTTVRTAQFTDFSLSEIDPDPEVPAPACVATRSDEFDGDAIDARWTTVRGTPTVGDGSATLPITQGDIDGGNAGAISYLGQRAPGEPWTATTKVTLEQDNEWQFGGLLLHVDDDNYTKLSFTKNSNDSRFFEFWSETNRARTGHATNFTVPAETGNTVYLRMVSDGTNLTAHYSLDGETFTQLGNPAPLKTGATIGPVAAGDTDAPNKTAAFDYFRITPDGPRAFDDEFDGSALDGCRWNRIHGWDAGNLAVADGKLKISTYDADIDGANNRDIQNLILQTPPAGDWTIETKVTAPLNDTWQLAGFMLYSDDDHYVKYDVVADNESGEALRRRTELRYENGGGLTGPDGVADEAPPASPTDTWFLRLTKTGDTYTGAIRVEGGTWHKTPGSVTVALANPALGLMAIGPDQDVGPIDVTFDYIKVVHNSAPAIGTATATPDAGKVPLPVQFTATATDVDSDELSYSWDFGNGGSTEDATTKDAAFTYTTPGTYTAKVTVSDGQATDSETVTVTVAPNAAPVVTTATATPTAGKAPLPVQFTAAATDADGDQLTYSWDFGNGGSTEDAATKDAAFTYTTPGTYTAKVTVTDGRETASKTVTVTVKANTAPVISAATATPGTGNAPLPVEFTATATDADGDTLSYSWDFGNGGATADAATKTAAFTYPAPGTYTAKVTVSDGQASVSRAVTVTVTQAPVNGAPTVVASADPAGGTAPLTVAFSATGQDPERDALTYAWSFGDGGTADGATATHTFAAAGTYAVTVTVKDAKGATGSAALTVVVGAGPGASGNPPSVIMRPVAPASIKAFAKRGVKVALQCPAAGKGTLSARVSKKVAKRLRLGRVLGTAKVTCVAGKTVSYRVKPSRKVRKALLGKHLKSLKVTLRLALPGRDAVERTLTVRR